MWRVAGVYASIAAIWVITVVVLAALIVPFKAAAGLFVCCGSFLLIPIALGAAILSAVLTTKAVIICVDRSASARVALGTSANQESVSMVLGGLDMLLMLVQQVFTSAAGCWFVASMTALAEIRVVNPTMSDPPPDGM